jgi:ComF family protein
MIALSEYYRSFVHLFFPRLCLVCGTDLQKQEVEMCRVCLKHLPHTHYAMRQSNPVEQVFWGRAKVERATSLLFYRKGEQVQKILHEIKYRGNLELGREMGRSIGHELMRTGFASDIDLLIPVPLHPQKKKQRGYNQSEIICEGIAEVTGISLNSNLLIREVFTTTQTRKGRFERYQNVDGVFTLIDRQSVSHRHLLLVDDVLTTGSTLEACANAILMVDDARVSIATLAFANL